MVANVLIYVYVKVAWIIIYFNTNSHVLQCQIQLGVMLEMKIGNNFRLCIVLIVGPSLPLPMKGIHGFLKNCFDKNKQ